MPLHNTLASAFFLFSGLQGKENRVKLFPLSKNQLVSVNGGPSYAQSSTIFYEHDNIVKEPQNMFPALEKSVTAVPYVGETEKNM